MNDQKQPGPDPVEPPPRTPNREFRRTPPVIEGEATPVRAADEPAANAPESGDAPPPEAAAAGAPIDDALPPAAPGAPDAPPPPPERRGYGFGAVAGASLASAALAALAVFGLQSAAGPSGPAPAALDARIAEVEKRAAAPAATPAALAMLEKRVASVEALASGASETARKAAEAAARPPAPSGAGLAPGASQQALDALAGRIATLEKSATTGAAGDLAARLSAVEKALSAPKAEDRATETRVEPAPPPDLDPLRKDVAALEARLQALEKDAAPLADAARAMDSRIRDLDARIQPLAGRIDESRAQGEAERKRAEALAERSAVAARMALAQSISAAIASGAPFAAQADALSRMGVPADRLAPLQAAAKTGVATNDELARSLAALEPKIVARAEPGADESVIDRLTNSALGLVRVRPSGEPTGDAPADVYARMNRAIRAGDVAAALKEWEKLPEAAKTASADWANRARARAAAEGAARAILSDQAQTIGRS